MRKLEQLQPEKVFRYFEEIASIPHGSGNTKAISDYLVSFAETHGLYVEQDACNNIIMIQEATEGYETAEPIIIQGHMDMVCEKEKDCTIDFERDGLDLYIDGDFVKAKGTTLGGDDGIAVAYALALLDSPELKHPRLEIILTVDEEIGLLGAQRLDLSCITGHRMLNIDSDLEDEFLTSCAGGISVNAAIPIHRMKQTGCKAGIRIHGLLGGHSGSEIDKERANPAILFGRILDEMMQHFPLAVLTMESGQKDNAIPREAFAEILFPENKQQKFQTMISELTETMKKEYSVSDSGIEITYQLSGAVEEEVLDFSSTNKLILFLRLLPNGVLHWSRQIPNLVETSSNLGIFHLKDEAITATISIRSSVSSRKQDLCNKVFRIIEMLGGDWETTGDYPAWEYKPDSVLREQITGVYPQVTGKEPKFCAIHAGLECGIFSEKIKDLDCVSFGPTNYDIHTPKERLCISSVQKYWQFLVALIEQGNKI